MATSARPLRYTPYDGIKKPFSIGLEPLDPAHWIEPDALLLDELKQKDELIANKRDQVFLARDDTHAAQAEARDALIDHLTTCHPARYARSGGGVLIDGNARRIDMEGEAPLLAASRLVQDDLCLMRNCIDGWRLVAASLCFPSSWSLQEKFDRPMDAIHEAVPGFSGQMATRIARIFDHLKPGAPVWRLNWSIYDDGALHHPETKSVRRWAGEDGSLGEQAFVRVERQTLAKLPISGDILFTIRVYTDPVTAFAMHPRGRDLAKGLRSQLLALDQAQLKYKNLLADRDRLAESLARFASD